MEYRESPEHPRDLSSMRTTWNPPSPSDLAMARFTTSPVPGSSPMRVTSIGSYPTDAMYCAAVRTALRLETLAACPLNE